MKKAENRFVSFVLSPGYRIQRHTLFIFALVVLSLDIAVNVPHYHPGNAANIIGLLAYIILIIGMMYLNAVVAVPRLLLKNKLFLYVLVVFGMVLAFLTGIFAIQATFFDLINELYSISPYLIFMNMLSSIMLITLLFAGVTTLMLFRYWLLSSYRVTELESATLQTELKFLKNQINPHFLFNMLNNVHVLFRENKKEASSVLYKLEDLLRYQIDESSKERILLISDIHFLNDYLNLEKIRRDNFHFTIQTLGEITNIELPPLLFIPFVENAVKHSQDSDQASSVSLQFRLDGDILYFHCENSMPVDSSPKAGVGGIGLKNIRRRLELLFPGKYSLELSECETKYMVDLQIYLK